MPPKNDKPGKGGGDGKGKGGGKSDKTPPTIIGEPTVTVNENQTSVIDFDTDDVTATWSLVGAVDDGLFNIDAATGTVTFKSAPDFEAPVDADGNNAYDITIAITDTARNRSTLSVTVTVADVEEDTEGLAYSSIVVFGDSLSDNGNFNALGADFLVVDQEGNPAYSVPFQYDGDGSIRTYSEVAFTDGTVYADTLAGLLFLEASYENYAFGGAEALGQKFGASYVQKYSNLSYTTIDGGTNTFSIVKDKNAALAEYGDFDINLAAQVDRYLEKYPDGVPDGTLAVLNIGANDLGEFDTSFFNILLGGVNEFAEDLGIEIETQSRRLAAAGVDVIALYTLPVAEFFIGYGDLNSLLEKPVARDLIDSVNDEIIYRSQLLNADGIATEVVRIDVMSEELLADMQTYGFLYQGSYLYGYSGDPTWIETSVGVIEPVFDVNLAATDYRAEQILFFDEIHPSGALHDMLAIFSSESLTTDEIFGSNGADVIDLTAADDFVVARGGGDVVYLREGDDVVLGGLGNDRIYGNDGSDLLIGGAGNDSLGGGGGSDLVVGGPGDDKLYGASSADILIGGLGNDLAYGNAGSDVFIFFEEELLGGLGGSTDVYDGGDGEDTLLVFLTEDGSATQTVSADGTSCILSFDDGSTLTAYNIENITLYNGLPEDTGSPIETLALNDDLFARYDEGQLWGIV